MPRTTLFLSILLWIGILASLSSCNAGEEPVALSDSTGVLVVNVGTYLCSVGADSAFTFVEPVMGERLIPGPCPCDPPDTCLTFTQELPNDDYYLGLLERDSVTGERNVMEYHGEGRPTTQENAQVITIDSDTVTVDFNPESGR